MIYRLRYCNKDGVEARVDIQKGSSTPVIEVEGTERPFILSYNNDKGDKSGMFLSSSADIEIYETPDFNINNLKTSNETELSVTHYINNVISWQGFIIPDFFSIEVRNNPVITMTASDRLGTLKNVTLSDLPSMISLRELAILCLNKTGLTLPLRTMADFNNGTGVNDFFNSKILTQRLSDTKGRSISCYDILSSILTASNSFLVQRSGGWHIINKIQHEAGSGKLYTGATSFINWSDVIFNFSDISTGGRRTIIPVASTVGVFHEFGGGRIYPENYDFSLDLTGWTSVNGFVAVIDNRKVDNFVSGTGVIPQEWTTDPVFGDPTEKKYLVNDNYGINYDFADKPYLRSSSIPVTYPNISQVKVSVEVNATGPYIDSETYRGETNFAVIASNGTSTLHLTGSGTFETLSGDPFLHKVLFDGDTHLQAVTSSRSVNGILAVQDGNLSGYNITVRIYGYTKGVTGGRFLVTTLVNSVAVTITDISDEAKGTLYKTERVDNFTKAHDIDTSLFADYLTTGLNGYFYDYSIDDTSSLYNSANELTSKWTAYNDPEQLPLLQHVTRQRSRLFSVAHDLLSAELEVNNFDPLAIFVACEKRYTVVSAQFDFFKSNLSVELEEVAFQNANVRDFIYSYFGDGESGIKSIGGISGGSGGGTGGGLTPEQIEILSWWKKDPDRENTIFTEMNAYSKLELSAYGADDGGGGGEGIIETVYGYGNLGQTFNNNNLTDTFNAYTINQINTRLVSVESGSATTVNTTGTGNAITSILKAGSVITANKGLTFLETSVFNTHNTDNVRHITGAERTKWDGVVTDFGNLEIGGRNLWTNSRTIPATVTITQYGYVSGFKNISELGLKTGELITFSVYVSNIPAGESVRARIDLVRPDGTYIILYGSHIVSDEGVVYISTSMRDTSEINRIRYRVMPVNYTADYQVDVVHEKLERGNIPTDWSPVFEDQVSDWLTTDVNSFSFIKNKPTLLSQFTDNIGVATHIANKANPHNVTTAQIGAVDLTTNQSIGGKKTFNTGVKVSQTGYEDFIIFERDASLWSFGMPSNNLVISNGDITDQSNRLITIGSNGNIRIGDYTANPLYKLDVAGTGRFTGNVTASISVTTPKVIFNSAGWSMEQVGSELQMKHNNVLKMRFTSAGSIVATEEITAFA